MVLERLAKPSTGNGFGVRVPGLPPFIADDDDGQLIFEYPWPHKYDCILTMPVGQSKLPFRKPIAHRKMKIYFYYKWLTMFPLIA